MQLYYGIRIVYEDNHLLVVVKPPNMPTQADASRDPDVHSLMKDYIAEKYQKPGAVYLGLVHRLDRPVGGLMVLGRTSKAADRLSEQVKKKTLARQYVAAVRGRAPDAGELHDWLLKDERTNTVRVVFTGRSHQIRVQLAHSGMPIWGDARYGGGKPGEQIALWGAHLGMVHPTLREELHFDVLPPKDAAPWCEFDASVWMAEKDCRP